MLIIHIHGLGSQGIYHLNKMLRCKTEKKNNSVSVHVCVYVCCSQESPVLRLYPQSRWDWAGYLLGNKEVLLISGHSHRGFQGEWPFLRCL